MVAAEKNGNMVTIFLHGKRYTMPLRLFAERFGVLPRDSFQALEAIYEVCGENFGRRGKVDIDYTYVS